MGSCCCSNHEPISSAYLFSVQHLWQKLTIFSEIKFLGFFVFYNFAHPFRLLRLEKFWIKPFFPFSPLNNHLKKEISTEMKLKLLMSMDLFFNLVALKFIFLTNI